MNFLILIENEEYVSNVIKILKEVYGKQSGKILYITFSRPYKSLEVDLLRYNIAAESFIVIDAITRRVISDAKNTTNCFYVQSPTSYEEVYDLMDYIFRECRIEHVVFDSLSSLAIYSLEEQAIGFIHGVIERATSVAKCETSFLCIDSDKDTPMVRRSLSCFDKVINMSKK